MQYLHISLVCPDVIRPQRLMYKMAICIECGLNSQSAGFGPELRALSFNVVSVSSTRCINAQILTTLALKRRSQQAHGRRSVQ